LEEFQAGEGKYAEIFNLSTGTSLVFKSLEEFQAGEGKYCILENSWLENRYTSRFIEILKVFLADGRAIKSLFTHIQAGSQEKNVDSLLYQCVLFYPGLSKISLSELLKTRVHTFLPKKYRCVIYGQ
jgi:hypothetical protein